MDRLVRRAKAMGELTVALEAALPAEYRGVLSAANMRDDGELVIVGRSSAWAARLRFETDRLLGAARAAGLEPSGVSIRVARRDD